MEPFCHFFVSTGDVYDVVITGQSAAIENTAVSLNCTSVGENVSYSWLKGDELVVPEGNVFLADDNKTLTFDPCTRDDTANYTCFAFNNFSSASSDPYWLEVFCKSSMVAGNLGPILHNQISWSVDLPDKSLQADNSNFSQPLHN